MFPLTKKCMPNLNFVISIMGNILKIAFFNILLYFIIHKMILLDLNHFHI